jgi:hypothetical protein
MALASLTFNNPATPTGPKMPETAPGPRPIGKPEKEKPNFMDKINQRKKEQLLKQKENLDRQLKTMKLARQIAHKYTSERIAAPPAAPAVDPNKDPQYLFQQVRPLLSKMNLANMTDPSKTQIETGKTNKTGDSLYCITLRRAATITDDQIERIKRLETNFESIQWTSLAIVVYVWYPFTPKAQAITPGAPGAPSAVPGPGQ